MLEKVDFNVADLSKEEYKATYDQLIDELVVLQQQARRAEVGLVVLFEGWDGAGKGSRISDLMYNMDARSTCVHVGTPLDKAVEKQFEGRKHGTTGFYPFIQEYWQALGERGTITFYDRGWYSKALEHSSHISAYKHTGAEDENHFLHSIAAFERILANNGYTVLKFFIHITKEGQKARLERLRSDPVTRWRVPDQKMAIADDYDENYQIFDRLLEQSNFEFAPWVLLNGEDKRRTNLAIARHLIQAIKDAIEQKEQEAKRQEARQRIALKARELGGDVFEHLGEQAQAPKSSAYDIVADYPRVETIDHTLRLEDGDYKSQLKELQRRFFRLENIMYQQRVPLILMYEGWDAAGKGGNIKRVAQALDARAYTIFPSPAPTKPELAHPHLWRYWTRLPKAGHVGIYDRSWYGRVLVERVENLAKPEEWQRAYDEINDFERDLVNWGALLLKFWVDVSPEEQLRRFEDRQSDPAKQWKITEEDWRNRDKYPEYKTAVNDMFRLTSTTQAPWRVLQSDDKKYARVKALRIIVDALEKRLDLQG